MDVKDVKISEADWLTALQSAASLLTGLLPIVLMLIVSIADWLKSLLL